MIFLAGFLIGAFVGLLVFNNQLSDWIGGWK